MDLFDKGDFKYNFALRVLSPSVFIVFTALLLYRLGYPELVVDIWKAAIWYVVATILILIAMNRLALVSLKTLILIQALSIYVSYLVYVGAISKGPGFLLPDEANLRTELWVLIAVYIYSLLGKYEGAYSNSLVHTRRVIGERLREIKRRYLRAVPSKSSSNQFFMDVLLSIMIYEDINRPQSVRFLERLLWRWRPLKVKTFGVMQVASSTPISDEESIRSAVTILETALIQVQPGASELERVNALALKYNPDFGYANDIQEIYGLVKEFNSEANENS